MSCSSAIIGNISGQENNDSCKETCDLSYFYSESPDIRASIKNDDGFSYLEISYSGSNKVVLQSKSYEASKVSCRLYKGSLHSFNGSSVIGEFIIKQGIDPALYICIPIVKGSVTNKFLKQILNSKIMSLESGDPGQPISIAGTNLNELFPSYGTPYYFYDQSPTIWPPECVNDKVGKNKVIVFGETHGIKIDDEDLNILNKIVTSSVSPLPSDFTNKGELFYNLNGAKNPNSEGFNGSGDPYLVDCQPVDGVSPETSDSGTVKSVNPFKFEADSPFFIFLYIIVGLFLIYLLIWVIGPIIKRNVLGGRISKGAIARLDVK